MSDPITTPPPPPGAARIAADPHFAELRGAYRRFVFPVTAAFLVWFLTYVLCSAYARDFMAKKITGNINVALVFGLLQFVSTFGIAAAYARFAGRRLDPLAAALRAGAAGAGPAAAIPATAGWPVGTAATAAAWAAEPATAPTAGQPADTATTVATYAAERAAASATAPATAIPARPDLREEPLQ